MQELQPAIIQSEFSDAIQVLQKLTRDHERTYRLGVGQYILQRFFGGSAAQFSSKDPGKDSKFSDFLQAHAADLAELDLAETTLRRCVRAHLCHHLLPPTVRDQLGWSALLQISRLGEPNQRARLAMATVSEKWPVAKVKAAVDLAEQNRLWDTEPDQAGLQLPDPKPPAPIQPGRLVTRSEKWGEAIAAWQAEFDQIDPKALGKKEVARLRAAVATVRGQLAELEARLG
ncbi:MAG: hypothetical protein HY902_15835 [Deltaproteobacteria bacterium]|nr:hypothetical protein [Deltaproteobacteria bacterium]